MIRTRKTSLLSALVSGLVLMSVAVSAFGSPINPPRRPVFGGTSTNWAGYADETNLTAPQSGAVSDVKGTWQVPFVTGTTNAWSAAWVGIDGYASSSVEQLGTSQNTSKSGPSYYAWYEMYPAPMVAIPGFAANPGNIITAEVSYTGPNTYVLSMTNTSTGQTFQTTQSASAQRSSAEWIMEAPSSNSGVLPLANFGVVNFSSCTATINGTTGSISAWPHDGITMVSGGRRNAVKATTSALSGSGDAFSVTWKHN